MLNSNEQLIHGKALWLIAAVICIYYTIVISLSYNFPISDDFYLIDFVTKIVTSTDINKSLWLLYAQHNEHRIVTTKLIFLIEYWIFNELNFRYLILIGNLFLLASFYLIIKNQPREFEQRRYLVVFTACMIFQYGSAESMFWAMAAISNYLVLMLALLTLSMLSKNNLGCSILAIVFSVLAVYTQGNGILMPFIASTYLISQKRYRESLIMIVLALIVLFIYFLGYQTPTSHFNPLNSIQYLGKILLFAVSFTGSAFGVGGSHYPVLTSFSLIATLGIGTIIWIITFYGFYKKTYSDGNIFIWFNLFVILTAIITGMARINFGLSQSMVSRYHIYSNFAVISTIVLILRLFPIEKITKSVLDRSFKILANFSVAYLALTFVLVPYFYFVVYSGIRSGEIIFSDKDQALLILDRARSIGVFSTEEDRLDFSSKNLAAEP